MRENSYLMVIRGPSNLDLTLIENGPIVTLSFNNFSRLVCMNRFKKPWEKKAKLYIKTFSGTIYLNYRLMAWDLVLMHHYSRILTPSPLPQLLKDHCSKFNSSTTIQDNNASNGKNDITNSTQIRISSSLERTRPWNPLWACLLPQASRLDRTPWIWPPQIAVPVQEFRPWIKCLTGKMMDCPWGIMPVVFDFDFSDLVVKFNNEYIFLVILMVQWLIVLFKIVLIH